MEGKNKKTVDFSTVFVISASVFEPHALLG